MRRKAAQRLVNARGVIESERLQRLIQLQGAFNQFEWNDPVVILHSSGSSMFDFRKTNVIKMWIVRFNCFSKAAGLYTRAVCISFSCTL